MKKNLFILAATAAALASCSNDVTTAVNTTLNAPQEITFRTTADRMTRASDITSATDLKSINVYAFQTGTTATPYINNVTFTGPTTYISTPTQNWPAYNLDFYAWSANSVANGDASTQVSTTAYNSYVVTPSTTAANQADFIYATASNKGAADNAGNVALAFTHKESRILVKVKNTNSSLSFSVTGWKLGFMVPNATFNGTTWTSPGTASASTIYTSDFSTAPLDIAYHATNTTALTGSQIMIPQGVTPVSAYASASEGAAVNGAYIGIQYTASTVSPVSEYQAQTWGIWKIPAITWEAGKQYTYIIDLAQGGYLETNKASTDENLDPIFVNTEIKFAGVTITDWVTDLNGNSTDDDDISATM